MILSSYERADSPFLYIQYGANAADRRFLKTSIRKTDKRRDQKLRVELNRLERQLLHYAAPIVSGDGWKWAHGFLATRYAARENTLASYRRQWEAMRLFLSENDIDSPGQVTRELLYDYPRWRKTWRGLRGRRRESKLATAILGLKVMAIVLEEAVTRGLILSNPAQKLNIQTEEAPLRPEITPDMERVIWNELQGAPDWMRKSFFLAINTGLRFATTRLHRSQIRPASDDIVIEKPKGGRKREFVIPIYESVRPMINDFVRSGDEWSWTIPIKGVLTGLEWTKFFRKSDVYKPHLCFHSTRVTFITRAMRAGVPESVVMKMVNHASKEISRIYQRHTSEDVRRYADQLPAPGVTDAPQ